MKFRALYEVFLEQKLAVQANCAVMHALEQQINTVETELLRQLKPCKAFIHTIGTKTPKLPEN